MWWKDGQKIVYECSSVLNNIAILMVSRGVEMKTPGGGGVERETGKCSHLRLLSTRPKVK